MKIAVRYYSRSGNTRALAETLYAKNKPNAAQLAAAEALAKKYLT